MNLRIWTPRYAFNRVNYFFFEKFNQDKPWITPKAIKELDKRLQKDFVGVEFGSGRSTLWYADRVKHLTSIEDHQGWYDKVKEQFEAAGTTNISYLLKNADGEPSETPYVKAIEAFENNSLHLVIVDGKHRDLLANAAVDKLSAGGILVVDDSQRYLAHQTHAPYAIKENASKMTAAWRSFQDKVDAWEMVWTTNGVSDTAIFIKP